MNYVTAMRKLQEEARRRTLMKQRSLIAWHHMQCPNCAEKRSEMAEEGLVEDGPRRMAMPGQHTH